MVSFTGSTAVGRRVMAAASATVKRVFLELGGKSAYVVLDDADVATVGLMAAAMVCTHAGQGCAITTRLVVPASMHDSVVDAVGATLNGMPYGDPNDESHLMGPLISERQRTKVEGLVATAQSEGAVLVRGRTPARAPAAGLLLRAHRAGRSRRGRHHRPAGGVRTGAVGYRLRRG